ncbi:MAG: hypothetical protein ACLTW9_26690 [Enterocloster sp.]
MIPSNFVDSITSGGNFNQITRTIQTPGDNPIIPTGQAAVLAWPGGASWPGGGSRRPDRENTFNDYRTPLVREG